MTGEIVHSNRSTLVNPQILVIPPSNHNSASYDAKLQYFQHQHHEPQLIARAYTATMTAQPPQVVTHQAGQRLRHSVIEMEAQQNRQSNIPATARDSPAKEPPTSRPKSLVYENLPAHLTPPEPITAVLGIAEHLAWVLGPLVFAAIVDGTLLYLCIHFDAPSSVFVFGIILVLLLNLALLFGFGHAVRGRAEKKWERMYEKRIRRLSAAEETPLHSWRRYSRNDAGKNVMSSASEDEQFRIGMDPDQTYEMDEFYGSKSSDGLNHVKNRYSYGDTTAAGEITSHQHWNSPYYDATLYADPYSTQAGPSSGPLATSPDAFGTPLAADSRQATHGSLSTHDSPAYGHEQRSTVVNGIQSNNPYHSHLADVKASGESVTGNLAGYGATATGVALNSTTALGEGKAGHVEINVEPFAQRNSLNGTTQMSAQHAGSPAAALVAQQRRALKNGAIEPSAYTEVYGDDTLNEGDVGNESLEATAAWAALPNGKQTLRSERIRAREKSKMTTAPLGSPNGAYATKELSSNGASSDETKDSLEKKKKHLAAGEISI